MAADVPTILANQQAFATASVDKADAFLAMLTNLAQTPFFVQSNAMPAPPVQVDVTTLEDLIRGLFPPPIVAGLITATAPVQPSTFGTIDALTGLSLPSEPSIDIPGFTLAMPSIDELVAPSNNFSFVDVTYQSALLDALKAKLLDNLQYGGYGIETADEVALFNRARDRETEAMMSRIEDAGRTMASRGFPLPPGELAIHVDRAYQALQDKMSDVSRDITLARTKLYVENRQFTIEQVKGLEQILIGNHNQVMDRALSAAKATIEMAVEVFKAQVLRAGARVELYRAGVGAFEAQLRGSLARVEVFRTVMEGKRIESDIMIARLRGQIETSQVALEAYKTKASVYGTEVGAQATALKAKADVFGAVIQGASAEANAMAEAWRLDITNRDLEFKRNVANAQLAIQDATLMLQSLEASIGLREKAAATGAGYYQALVGGAVNSINTLAAVVANQ
jgi:hypothetical protein